MLKHTILLLCICSCAYGSKALINVTRAEDSFVIGFHKYLETGEIIYRFKTILDILDHNDLTLIEMPDAKMPRLCLQCRLTIFTLLSLKNITKLDDWKTAIFKLRKLVYKEPDYVIEGENAIHTPFIRYILEQRPNLTSIDVCAIIFDGSYCGTTTFTLPKAVDIDTNASAKKEIAGAAGIHNSNGQNFTVLHLTDIHFDPLYKMGSSFKCSASCCCRENQGEPKSDEEKAGKWGAYGACDSPWEEVENVMKQIKSQHTNIDYVYFTGDIIDHFGWATSREKNVATIKKVNDLLKTTFPNTPIYWILGNHESHPANLYAPENVKEEFSTKWLYDLMESEWGERLASPEAKSSILRGGYYTALVRPKLRIIALNNNFCFTYNYWLVYDQTYFGEHLQWLNNVLAKAEKDNEFVHIIGHVPSNDRFCHNSWKKPYKQIIERFSHIIKAQFNGHSHNDEVNLYYSEEKPDEPFSVAWNGGCQTTFIDLNPNYRLYAVDDKSFEVIDHETWIFNLTEANLHPDRDPAWFKEYSFREYYELPDLSLKSMNQFLKNLTESRESFDKYYRVKNKLSDPLLDVSCDEKCRERNLCDIVLTELNESKCEEFKPPKPTASMSEADM